MSPNSLFDAPSATPSTLPQAVLENEEGDIALDLYAERAYLEYAMSVVKGRALPDVSDGQKPVQRRILYAMRDMGLVAGAKPVKSARVVGEILGKYHPHGDSSAYEALVRMAQDFTLRYPLIDGQGNFGSRDGDGAAAMRYTEARLTPIADLLLSEIDQGTVDFVPNYDGAFFEPNRLPARLPMLLLNGASGIAVGMATEIPPHNLREVASAAVALLRNPELDTADLMTHIPAPDFPGGGQIISSTADILSAYETGRGAVRVRARWEVEPLARGQWRIIVRELPPGCSAQKVLSEIEEMTNPKVKAGKKSLSPEQQNLKALLLSQLDRVRDESDGTQPVRLVFEPKSSRQDPAAFMNLLLAQTSMEGNVSLNLVMVGLDGRPAQKGLKAILSEWLAFRVQTLTRRLEWRLSKVEQRLHILAGRQTVFLNIDAVIHTIRESDDPKAELMSRFGLSTIQADDILEIRLRQLARLEGLKIEKELAELGQEADELRTLLSDERAKRRMMIREIEADAKKHGDARRSTIEVAEKSVMSKAVTDEAITVILSQKGWIRARNGHGIDPASLSFKDGDALHSLVETRTVWSLVLFDHQGRSYSLDPAELPSGRGDGAPLSTLIELQDGGMPLALLTGLDSSVWLIAGSGGYGFTTRLEDLGSRMRTGKAFLTLDAGEVALVPQPIATSAQRVLVVSQNGKALAFGLDELKQMNKGRGLMLMSLEEGDTLATAVCVSQERVELMYTNRNGREDGLRVTVLDYLNKRAKRGKPLTKKIRISHIREL